MRIARIIEYFPPHIGGMERHGLSLSKEQIKMGHQVDVFIGVGDTNLLPVIYKMPCQFLPIYGKIRRICFNVWAYFKVRKIHKKNPYDIIHLHGDFVEAYFGGKLSKKLDVPAVLTIHAGINKRLLKPKNSYYFKNISKVICVSEEIANDLKSIGIPENKLAVISSGIYLSRFDYIDKNKKDEIVALRGKYSKPIIISIGVLRPAKGFGYLIEAFIEFKRNFDRATLLIIGDGPDRKKLKDQAKNIDGINFLDRLDNDKIIEYLKAADIFVLASIFTEEDREGTPTSIMEAMAAGLPIVATKVGGIPYLVKDGINGLIVGQGNVAELTAALSKIATNAELRHKMIERNSGDIKEKDWPVIAETINETYESVL